MDAEAGIDLAKSGSTSAALQPGLATAQAS
jgi:hypothetical protein